MGDILCYLKSCTKCRGDLILDEGYWRCWQCGLYYYRIRIRADNGVGTHFAAFDREAPFDLQDSDTAHHADPGSEEVRSGKPKRRGYGARSSRNIDAVIRAKRVSDERWWARNRQAIEYLDQGSSIREIAVLLKRGERQIRVVRERLTDLRLAGEQGPRETA